MLLSAVLEYLEIPGRGRTPIKLMTRLPLYYCLPLVLLVGIIGCSRQKAVLDQPHNFAQVSRKAPYARIVSLAPNLTEILFAIGAGGQVVGRTRFCNYPPESDTVPVVGGFLDPSTERILSLKPDIVMVVKNSGNRRVVEKLTRLGIPVYFNRMKRLADLYEAVDHLGRITGRSDQAALLLQQMKNSVRRARQRAGLHRTKVVVVYGHRPLVIAGPRTFADELLDVVGAENAGRKLELQYPTVSPEVLLSLAPELILDASVGAHGSDAEEVARFWSRISQTEVRIVPSDILARPGPRIVQALEILAAATRIGR